MNEHRPKLSPNSALSPYPGSNPETKLSPWPWPKPDRTEPLPPGPPTCPLPLPCAHPPRGAGATCRGLPFLLLARCPQLLTQGPWGPVPPHSGAACVNTGRLPLDWPPGIVRPSSGAGVGVGEGGRAGDLLLPMAPPTGWPH